MTHIAVLGSTNTDLAARVEKAPRHGETVPGREFRTIPGGKGANQAIAAARVGATVSMIAAVGNDGFGTGLPSTLELPLPAALAGDTYVGALAVALGASASMPHRSEIEARYTS